MPKFKRARLWRWSVLFFFAPVSLPQPPVRLVAATPVVSLPSNEALSYEVEWRLIYAGSAQLNFTAQNGDGKARQESKLHLESGGLVSKLYKLDDHYRVQLEDQLCATSVAMDAIEGKRQRETTITVDRRDGKAKYVERDKVKNHTVEKEIPVPACVSDFLGGFYKLRTVRLEPGQSTQIPLTDGKKAAMVRVDGQEREDIKLKSGTFKTVRYEVFVFNGVILKRDARLQIWLTDDSRRLPVQIRAKLAFPVGSITFSLDKEQHS